MLHSCYPSFAEWAQRRAEAVRLAVETVFSLTVQGAIVVAVTNLAEFALKQILPEQVIETLVRGFNTGVLAKASEQNSQQAFNELVPQMASFAQANEAGVLEAEYDKPKETPLPVWLPLAALLLALATTRLRRADGKH